MRTVDLTGAALDWAVATAIGEYPHWDAERSMFFASNGDDINYSTNWAQGGPIIEREVFHRIVRNLGHGYTVSKKIAVITDDDDGIRWVHGAGPTILIAAMRCYVASKLGDTIEVPDEITKG